MRRKVQRDLIRAHRWVHVAAAFGLGGEGSAVNAEHPPAGLPAQPRDGAPSLSSGQSMVVRMVIK